MGGSESLYVEWMLSKATPYVSTGYELDGLVGMVRQGRLTVGDGWRNMCVSEGMAGDVCEEKDGWRRMGVC